MAEMLTKKYRTSRSTEVQEVKDPSAVVTALSVETPVNSKESSIINRAIEHHLAHPPNGAVYRTPLWEFTRSVFSQYPDGVDPRDVFYDLVEPEISQRGGWSILGIENPDREELYNDFIYCWQRIRFRIDEDPVAVALKCAELMPLEIEGFRDSPSGMYKRFVSLAGWLQHLQTEEDHESRPIMLPCEKLASMLGCSPMAVSRMRTNAVRDCYLEEVSGYSYTKNRATEFRFNMFLFYQSKNKPSLDAVRSGVKRGGYFGRAGEPTPVP